MLTKQEIETLIDALETEAERRAKKYHEQGMYEGDSFDLGFAEGLTFAIEQLKGLV